MRRFTPFLEGVERRALCAVGSVAPGYSPMVAPPTGEVFPFVPAAGQPTTLELARERYYATFSGKVTIGPPQFTSQSAVLRMHGVGTSSQFLTGNIQMAIGLPATPGGAIVGGAYLADKNLSGSTELGLDINFDPASVDAKGRPTRGAWSADSNVYGGINFAAQGSGTVTIRYVGNGAIVTFQGNLYTNGITNPLGNTNIQP